MLKKNDPIPSYSLEELKKSQPSRNILVLVEKNDDIYNQVKLSNEEFEQVCKIINKGTVGFSLNVFSTPILVDVLEEDEE